MRENFWNAGAKFESRSTVEQTTRKSTPMHEGSEKSCESLHIEILRKNGTCDKAPLYEGSENPQKDNFANEVPGGNPDGRSFPVHV